MADQQRLFGRRCKITIAQPFVKDYTQLGPSRGPGQGRFKGTVDIGHRDTIEINGGDSIGMRVQFTIKKTSEKEPNTGEIVVTNLAESTRHAVAQKGVTVTVDAGYEATGITRIFRGDARSVDHIRQGADWETTFKCGDGERGYRHARLNESFAPNTSAADIAERLIESSAFEVGSNIAQIAPAMTKIFQHGYSVTGSSTRSLDRLLKAIGFAWSIQDGAIIIRKIGDPAPKDHIPVISPTSGLIGSPEFGAPEHKKKPALLKFKSLLIPTKPGRSVELSCERYHGLVELHKVHIQGDTHGGDWYTEMQGLISRPLSG